MLVNRTTGEPVRIGDHVQSFRGEHYIITGVKPPHKAGASGYVIVKPVAFVHSNGAVFTREPTCQYYVTVFGLEYRPHPFRSE